MCDYYFYDKNNDLLYDPFIKPFKYYQSNTFNIKYKPINNKSAHILAILRLNYSTLTFLKSLGYNKIQMSDPSNQKDGRSIFIRKIIYIKLFKV